MPPVPGNADVIRDNTLTPVRHETQEAANRLRGTRPLPRLCFVGPMVGRNPGRVTTQGEILSDMLAEAGYSVRAVSAAGNRYVRLADIVSHLLTRGRWADIQCLQVFSGASFVIADLASMIGKAWRQRVVMVLRGGALPDFMARHPAWARRVFARADAIVAPSPYLAHALEPYGFRSRVIPNLLDVSRYTFRHRTALEPRLLWMRGFHPLYNPEMAVRTLARLRAKVPEATLGMAGQDGPSRPAVLALARELGVDGAVRFLGFLGPEGKRAAGDEHDIFINTNRVDNTPVGLLEAAAMGMPIVSTGVGGIPHLFTHEETALLVSDDNDEAMAGAVLRLLADPDRTGHLSNNGRALAQSCSRERVLPQWQALFEGVLDLPPGR